MFRALDIGGDRVFCDGVVEGENQDHVADGLRQHEHAEHRDGSGKYSNGDIESEREQDPEPDEAEALRLHTIQEIQSDDHSPKDHEGNVSQDPPEHGAFIREPSVLREETDENADDGKCVNSCAHALLFLETIIEVCDMVHEHVKDGHGDGGYELADAQRGGEICVNEIVQYPGYKMECVTASEDQHRCSHQFFRAVSGFHQDQDPDDDRCEQIKDIKKRFSVFQISPRCSNLSQLFMIWMNHQANQPNLLTVC